MTVNGAKPGRSIGRVSSSEGRRAVPTQSQRAALASERSALMGSNSPVGQTRNPSPRPAPEEHHRQPTISEEQVRTEAERRWPDNTNSPGLNAERAWRQRAFIQGVKFALGLLTEGVGESGG